MINRRKNSNPEKSFENACEENNIILTERKENLEPMRIIDDLGNVKVWSSVEGVQSPEEYRKSEEYMNSLILEVARIREINEEKVKELEKEFNETFGKLTMESKMISSVEKKHKNIIQKWVTHISDLVQGRKKQYE